MRLVIADDSAVVRDGLSHALQAHGHAVVATAADGVALLAYVESELPEVALIDIRMPPTHSREGLDAAATTRTRAPTVALLILFTTSTPTTRSRSCTRAPHAAATCLKTGSPS